VHRRGGRPGRRTELAGKRSAESVEGPALGVLAQREPEDLDGLPGITRVQQNESREGINDRIAPEFAPRALDCRLRGVVLANIAVGRRQANQRGSFIILVQTQFQGLVIVRNRLGFSPSLVMSQAAGKIVLRGDGCLHNVDSEVSC
jgi:hypothetical protein